MPVRGPFEKLRRAEQDDREFERRHRHVFVLILYYTPFGNFWSGLVVAP
jgi:hypothetical protein